MTTTDTSALRSVAVLAKAPEIGRVKTRMRSALGDYGALQLHWWCVRRIWQRVLPQVSLDHARLFVTQEHPSWAELPLHMSPRLQMGAHLGTRMYHALRESFKPVDHGQRVRAEDAVLLLGTDSPTLPPQRLTQALTWLNASPLPRVAVGPAEDGGYYTIGCNRAAFSRVNPLMSAEIQWGSSSVFEQTINILKQLNLEYLTLDPWYDLDRPEDLERLFEDEEIREDLTSQLRAHPLSPPTVEPIASEYAHALSQLFGLTRFGERFDLSAPRSINAALGDPLSDFRSILIGGTNGKGSTSEALRNLAQLTGHRVGVFTSPHLISFRERIRVNDEWISPEEVIEGVREVFLVAENSKITLSFFEAAWAIACWYFRLKQVDWVIWEVGLGGRLDATNVCEPEASAIVSLSLDHTHILGSTLDEIASEKAPIFRENRPALTGCHGEPFEILRPHSPPHLTGVEARVTQLNQCWQRTPDQDRFIGKMVSTHHGRENLALAFELANSVGWFHDYPELKDPMSTWWSEICWAGRLEYLQGIWLDAAHNPDSARTLSRWLDIQSERQPKRARHLFVGMSADKDIQSTLSLMAQRADHITFVSPSYPRCLSAEELAHSFEQRVLPHLKREISYQVTPSLIDALRARGSQALNVVTGSCFLVGEARAWLLGIPFPECGIKTIAR